mmetsp:Transcript_1648/g.4353  ORF Transcript_1648/g.4353 Transcript_1648/m.4353 type:complete len:300 (-) Transcript_1648:1780-2679(-)
MVARFCQLRESLTRFFGEHGVVIVVIVDVIHEVVRKFTPCKRPHKRVDVVLRNSHAKHLVRHLYNPNHPKREIRRQQRAVLRTAVLCVLFGTSSVSLELSLQENLQQPSSRRLAAAISSGQNRHVRVDSILMQHLRELILVVEPLTRSPRPGGHEVPAIPERLQVQVAEHLVLERARCNEPQRLFQRSHESLGKRLKLVLVLFGHVFYGVHQPILVIHNAAAGKCRDARRNFAVVAQMRTIHDNRPRAARKADNVRVLEPDDARAAHCAAAAEFRRVHPQRHADALVFKARLDVGNAFE